MDNFKLTLVIGGIVQIILIATKLFGAIGWSWWIILIPLWIFIIIVITACVLLYQITKDEDVSPTE